MSEASWTQLSTEDEAAGWIPLAPPPEEMEFQAGVRDTGWFREYVQEHGEEPDLRPMSEDPKQGPNYNYRKAWNAGIRPTRAKYDRGKYHWPSSTPEGEHLKSKNHPTRWKEDYMREYGADPDAQPQLRQGPPPWSSPFDRIAYNWNRQGGAEGLKEAAGQDVEKIKKGFQEWNRNLHSSDPLRQERAITQSALLLAGGAATRGVLKMGAAGNFSRSTLGMFAGEKAATANHQMLALAKTMQKENASREDIWRVTGWFQGGDGKWRFEIDDRGASLDKAGYEKFRRRRPGSEEPMTNVVQHPLVREAYPGRVPSDSWFGGRGFDDIRLTRGETTPDAGGGLEGYGGASSGEAWDRMMLDVGGRGPAQGAAGTRSTALHELMHHIQEAEGFAQGGDPRSFILNKQQAKKLTGLILEVKAGRGWLEAKAAGKSWEDFNAAYGRRYNRDPPSNTQLYNDADLDQLKQMEHFSMQRLRDAIDPAGTYLHLAGEAEARLVQLRQNYTPQQRRDIPPWYDLERMGYPERKLSYRRREDNPFLVD